MPRKATMPRACTQCGTMYVPRSANKGACSRVCSEVSRRRRTEPPCETCGKIFLKPPASPARFCSRACSFAFKTKGIAERFWPNVDRSGDCWLWTSPNTDRRGYGRIYYSPGKSVPATHVAWEIASGQPFPNGFQALHTCDIPACVQNDEAGTYVVRGIVRLRFGHIWAGTHEDNMADRNDKGRQARGDRQAFRLHPESSPRGERNRGAILTEMAVAEIRRLMDNALSDPQTLSARFGVTTTTIASIAQRKSWRHLP